MPKQFEQLQQMELKANLNERQKEFLEKLKAELEQISAGYNAEQLAKRGDIRSLEMFVEKKREIMEFLETKKMPIIEFHGIEIKKDHAAFIEDLAKQAIEDNLEEGEGYEDLSEEEIRKREEKWEKELIDKSEIDENGFIIKLSCNSMNLTELPDLPQSLQELDCGINDLTELPDLPQSLQLFVCGENKLTELPDLPQSLQRLNCSFNKLTELPDLPQGLQRLRCFNNKLTELPDLPQSLQYLWCNSNQLTELPDLPQSLQRLDCSFNKLTELPDLPQGFEYINCLTNPLSNKAIRKIRQHPNARNFDY